MKIYAKGHLSLITLILWTVEEINYVGPVAPFSNISPSMLD